MNTKRKALISFAGLEDTYVHLIAARVLLKLTGNANYPFPTNDTVPPLTQPPDPAPPTPNLTDANALYFTKLLNSGHQASTADNNAKDEARVIVEGMLNKWAVYVNLRADGNLAKLLTSGFDLNKEKEKAGILPAPETPKVSSPGAGQFEGKTKPVRGAGGYLWRFIEVDFDTEAPVPGAVPFTIPTVPGKVFIADDERLKRATAYKVQVAAIGADRTATNWSDGAVLIIS